jgi:hypothetical protein
LRSAEWERWRTEMISARSMKDKRGKEISSEGSEIWEICREKIS